MFNFAQLSQLMEKKIDANKEQIERFLKEFQERMKWSCPPIIYIDRYKNNLQELATIDITGNQRDEIIRGLTYIDYMEGPYENKTKGQGDVWVFGKAVKGTDLYIKIYINTILGKSNICISFHISEESNTYPLKPSKL